MTPIPDDLLMAYADGELDGPEREAVERAMQDDAQLAARVERLAGQRRRLQAGLRAELDEPVPERLTRLLGEVPAAPVVDLAAIRAQRAVAAPPAPPRRAGSSWWQWGGMAASLLLGVAIARLWPGADAEAPAFAQRGGSLVAEGALAQALTSRLASEAPGAVAVQLSFVDGAGAYCRTFSIERAAGLACRDGAAWVVQTLAAAEPAAPGAMRQAASGLPQTVLDAVDRRIAGDALDATAERAARDRGWTR